MNKLRLAWDMLCAFAARHRDGDPSRILLVRVDGFGDFSLFLPFALALRNIYPAERFNITMLCNAMWCDIAKELLPFDNFIPLEVSRYMTDFEYRSEKNGILSDSNYGVILQSRFFREPGLEDRLALAAGAACGTAFAVGKYHLQHSLGAFLEVYLYDCLAGGEPVGEHEIIRNRRFFDTIGVFKHVTRPELPAPLDGWGRGGYMVLLPGSGKGVHACWPPARWGSVLKKRNFRCAVIGSVNEVELVTSAANSIGENATAFAGNLSPVEFAAMIANAAYVIGNDTGGIHFAAWCGVPALALCGGGLPGWYYPYPDSGLPEYILPPKFLSAQLSCEGCRWHCSKKVVSGVYPCLEAITPDMVDAELERLIP